MASSPLDRDFLFLRFFSGGGNMCRICRRTTTTARATSKLIDAQYASLPLHTNRTRTLCLSRECRHTDIESTRGQARLIVAPFRNTNTWRSTRCGLSTKVDATSSSIRDVPLLRKEPCPRPPGRLAGENLFRFGINDTWGFYFGRSFTNPLR